MKIAIALTAAVCLAIGGAAGFYGPEILRHAAKSSAPYAGQQERAVTSLSSKDIEQLRAGAGWGLAKPAEFNGYPGPAHIIEFADKLDLTTSQRQSIDAAFAAMQVRAKQLGAALIDAELALDTAFRENTIDRASLDDLLSRTEQVRAQLRSVHLATHLEVTPVLNETQKARYAQLRGYAGGHGGH
ncbi:Spy/CpxP family protein refolding chaperone [Ahrensia sp. R2A130]|uniref:Spy/CpxP family protein refolding chaperone n=1 Tax=Ahrensia sp. R2A130 TaxID=744979 RepID=UPI0001E0D883|nr:Spy/CpxP family protein refolding chaperone [Ahrensia sp. R2A130]EFL87920.1 conserved hypothetical protein [Ahrensia sp. R2A130]